MGDYFQTIVDLDASPQDAPALAQRVVDWLVTEGIVLAERTDCVFGPPTGHPPGPNWHRAVAEDDADWEPYDGLAVYTGRTVFHGGQGGPEAVTCPRCGVTTPLLTEDYDHLPDEEGEEAPAAAGDDAWARFAAAINPWHETGEADVVCPACTTAVPLPAWTWADDYFAFAHLGFEFWNWPRFTDAFHSRVTDLLGGHRTVRVGGKL
ncbi:MULTISPECIES: hypothetical protein [unclassified Streptomyces]|uniref:hypothetical protein n=1 Tax=unclassified Streptomyces TaxID=2593676 RepID=UPI0036F5FDAE